MEEDEGGGEERVEVNEDLVVLAAFETVSRHQWETAKEDLQRLRRLQDEALQDPDGYVQSLVQGSSKELKIRPQPLVPWPNIAWNKYPSLDPSIIPHPFDLMPTPTLGRDVARLQADFDHLSRGRRRKVKVEGGQDDVGQGSELREAVKTFVQETKQEWAESPIVLEKEDKSGEEEDDDDDTRDLTPPPSRPAQTLAQQSRSGSGLTHSPGRDSSRTLPSTRLPGRAEGGSSAKRARGSMPLPQIPERSASPDRETGPEITVEIERQPAEPSSPPPAKVKKSHHKKETPKKAEDSPATAGTPWTAHESALLEKLLKKYPEENVQSNRYNKISAEMGGTRTARQVASRCQKLREKEARRAVAQ